MGHEVRLVVAQCVLIFSKFNNSGMDGKKLASITDALTESLHQATPQPVEP